MCEPTTLAMASFAMGTAQQVMSYQAESANADAVNAAAEQTRVNSISSMQQDYAQLGRRQQQEQDSASGQLSNRKTQERKELSSARVSAGEAGISGLSVEGLMRDISAMSLRDAGNINQGTDWKTEQLSAEMTGVRTQTAGRISSAPTAAKPSPWGMAFGIGATAINSYDGYVKRTGKDPIGDKDKKKV